MGSFGASALVLILLLRVLLLARLDGLAPWALIATQGASRVPPIWLMAAMDYVSADAEAKSKLVARAGTAQTVLATAFGVIAVALTSSRLHLTLRDAAVLALTAALVAGICGWRFRVRLGGITGDFLGATQQVVECALLLAIVLVAG